MRDRCIADGDEARGVIMQCTPGFRIVMTRGRYFFQCRRWKSPDDDDRGISLVSDRQRYAKAIDRRLWPEYTSVLVISCDRRSRCRPTLHIIPHYTSRGSDLSDVTNLPSAVPECDEKSRRGASQKKALRVYCPSKSRAVNRTIASHDAFYSYARVAFFVAANVNRKANGLLAP